MAKRTITIKQGTTTIVTLYSGPSTWVEANATVTDVEGMERWDNVEIETVPKLFGNGSYVVSKRIGEIVGSISGDLFLPNVRAVYTRLSSAAASLEPVVITQTGLATTQVDAYITGVQWQQRTDEEASFTVEFKAVAGALI